jgi:uncharacterized membrane protein YecN with MAPEG domain
MKILPIYAALLAVLFAYLSFRTIRARRRLGIGLGHAESPVMLRAMRVHANFAEYVPFALLLIFLVESSGANPLVVHALGVALLVARLSHAYGVSQQKENFRFRVFGMATTLTVLLLGAIYLLIVAATR